VTHLRLDRGRLFAATVLGSTMDWDLGVFHRGYCQLLHQVWADVPVVWEEGRPILRGFPQDHSCALGPVP
jgi:hypothetical protein